MLCKNCGTEINENQLFCTKCGTRTEETNQDFAENATQPVPEAATPDETVAPAPKPKKKFSKKPLIISISALLVVIIASVSCYAFIPTFQNWVNKTFMSPEDYFSYVVDKNSKELAKDISAGISDIKNSKIVPVPTREQGEVIVTLGDEFHNIMQSASPADAQTISWVDNFSMTYDASTDLEKVSADFDFKLNNTKITSAEIDADFNAGYMYFKVPELSSNAARIYDYSFKSLNYSQFFNAVDKAIQLLPDENTTESIVTRYANAVAGALDTVEKEDRDIEIAKEAHKVTVLTVKVGEATTYDVAEAVLKELKEDEEIETLAKNYISAFGGNAESYSKFKAEIDTTLENIRSQKASKGGTKIPVDFYVDGNGKLLGFGIDYQGVKLMYAVIENGDSFSTELSFSAQGQSFAIIGKGSCTNDILNGKYSIVYSGNDIVDINCENIDMNAYMAGNATGKVTVTVADGAKALLNLIGNSQVSNYISGLKIECESDGNNAKAVFSTNGKPIITVDAKRTSSSGTPNITIPSGAIDVTNTYGAQIWASSVDYEGATKLIESLVDAGLPEDIVSSITPEQQDEESQTDLTANGLSMNNVGLSREKQNIAAALGY